MNFLAREVVSFHAAALILGAAALASKLLGLLRDRLLAGRFGAGDVLDAYFVAFQVPDALYTLFLVGAASAAVLPVFLDYERGGTRRAEEFIGGLLTIFSAGALVVAAIIALAAPLIVPWIAPGFSVAKLGVAASLTRLMMLSPVLLGIAGILSSVLQARHRFLVFALPPIVYNLGIIIGIVALVPLAGPAGLAWGVVLGSGLQVLVQVPALRAMRFPLRLRLSLREPGLRRVLRTAAPRVAAISMGQLTLVALAALASYFAAGSISVFKFAQNLAYVPVSLFGVSWAMALFPKLAAASLEARGEEFSRHLALGIRNVLFFALPALTLFIVLRAHLVRVVLGTGAFDWEDTRLTAALVAFFALAIASESLLPLMLLAFYALGRTALPLAWNVLSALITVGLAAGLSLWFTRSPTVLNTLAGVLRIGDLASPLVLAVGMAFAAGSLANVGFLAAALRGAARRELGVRLSLESGALAAMLGAAVLAGLAAYGALLPFPALVATNTLPGIFLQGAVAGIVGLLVYGGALWWQGNPEVAGLVESIRSRILSPQKTPQVYEVEKLDTDGR